MANLYSNIASRLILDVLSRGTVIIINIIVARFLGPGPFGKFSYLFSLAQLFYVFAEAGTHLQLGKEMGENRGRNEFKWAVFAELRLFLSLICLLVGIIISPWIWHWENSWLVPVALIWMLSNSFLDFSQFLCNGLGDMVAARQFLVTQRLLMIAGVAVPLIFHPTLESTMIGMAAGSTVGIIFGFLNFSRSHSPQWAWNPAEMKEIFRRSFPIGVSGAFGGWYIRIGMVILGWVALSDVIGAYSAAFRIYEASYIIPTAIMGICMPYLSHAYKNEPGSAQKEFIRVSQIMLAIGALWGLFLFVGRDFLIHILFGPGYEAAVPLLKIFSIVGFMVFVNYLFTHMMIVFGHQRRHALNQGIVFAVGFFLNVLWVPSGGPRGAAYVLLACETLLFILTITVLWRRNRGHILPGRFDTIEIYERT